jgi:hypothetical protein
VYEPKKITKESIRNNENAPSVVPSSYVFDVSIEPNVYFFILKFYHAYVYLITHHLNYMLKAQFRQLFSITESAARHRFQKLVEDNEYSILEKKEYKGSHCIFPVHRAFSYSEVNFPIEKKKRLDYEPNESAMFKGFMQTEYWLQFGDLMVEELEFFPDYLPKELNREEPFSYHYKALFWMIKDLKENYVQFAEKYTQIQMVIDKEVPIIDVEALDEKEKEEYRKKHPESLLAWGLDSQEKASLEKENELSFRFRKASYETQKKYIANINKAAFATLLKSDVYVIRVVPLASKKFFEPHFEIHLVIYHLPNHGASRYNRIITALQKITCYQNISVKLNITVAAHSDKTKDEAYWSWGQAVKRREERTDKVNLEYRAEKDRKRIKRGELPKGITEKDIETYCKTSNKFCEIDEVRFVNLRLDRYFRHHLAENNDFEPGSLDNEY